MIRAPGRSRRGLADRLARLALGLGGHRAGVDDDRVFEAGGAAVAAHHLGFEGVEAAAEGDDIHGQSTARSVEQGGIDHAREARPPPGPVMSDMTVVAPFDNRVRRHRRRSRRGGPVRPRRAAATRAAQAPVPQAGVMPAPRSQTRSRMRSGDRICATPILARWERSRSCSSTGPSHRQVDRVGVGDEEQCMGIAHAGRDRIAQWPRGRAAHAGCRIPAPTESRAMTSPARPYRR